MDGSYYNYYTHSAKTLNCDKNSSSCERRNLLTENVALSTTAWVVTFLAHLFYLIFIDTSGTRPYGETQERKAKQQLIRVLNRYGLFQAVLNRSPLKSSESRLQLYVLISESVLRSISAKATAIHLLYCSRLSGLIDVRLAPNINSKKTWILRLKSYKGWWHKQPPKITSSDFM